MRYIFDPEPFCYGPASIAITIAKNLKSKFLGENDTIIALTTGTSMELCRRENCFDEIIDCKTADGKNLDKHHSLIDSSNVYFSITNPASIKNLDGKNIRKVYLDLLFWMWNSLELDASKDVDEYMVQNFYGTENQAKRLGVDLRSLTLVNPILPISENKIKAESGSVLITLGGLDTIYAKSYPTFHVTLLTNILKNSYLKEKKVFVAGGGSSINIIKEEISSRFDNVSVGSLSRDEFSEKLKSSEHVLCNPGIITYNEAKAQGKSVFFLPPHNYSQYLQFNLIKNSDRVYGLNYDSLLGEDGEVKSYLPELEGIESVQRCMKKFLETPIAMQEFMDSLEAYVSNSLARVGTTIDNNNDNGLDAVCNRLLK